MNTLIKYGLCLVLSSAISLMAQGRIKGVVRTDSGAAPGVLVTVQNADSSFQETTETGGDGHFLLTGIPAGTYSVEFSSPGLLTKTETDVKVADGDTTNLNINLTAPLNVMEVLTVAAASRRPERIVEAPAAVTLVTSEEIASQAATGQLPKVLESTPGVELAQSGVFDFNINARGFNSSLNRRVLVLIDGRDPSTGFLGNQEWAALSFGMEELESMEFVRGPGSALYGANAFNGVLNIRSKRPSDTLGGRAAVSAGTLDYSRIDLRYAGEFGRGWSYRINGGTTSGDTWSESRTGPGPFEYAGLENNSEVLNLDQVLNPDGTIGNVGDTVETVYYTLRLDKEMNNGDLLTVEGGTANTENGLAVTGLGRVRIDESDRPWFRVNYNSKHWNALYTYTTRDTPRGQTSLSSGTKLWEDSSNEVLEIQGNYDFMDGRIQLVAGASYREQEVDTRDGEAAALGINHQSLMVSARKEDQQSLFGQVKFELNEQVDLVLAGRYDDSTLHDAQESPKAAVVYKINPNHSIRATFGQAFQTANYSEFFLRAAAGRVPFNAFQDGVVLGGFGLDLRSVGQDGLPLDGTNGPPLMNWLPGFAVAVGNDRLVVEEIESYEIGYKGIVSSKLFLTIDVYQSEAVNFITDLLPGVNSGIAPFQILENIPAAIQAVLLDTLAAQLGGLAAGLTNQSTPTNPFFAGFPGATPDGHPVVTLSYTNAGEVETEGFDIAFNYYLNDYWIIDGNYSFFDFTVVDEIVEGDLVPNASENKFNLGISYSKDKISAGLKFHSVEGFPYAAGVFVGDIPSYSTVNLTFNYTLNESWKFSVAGNNIFDDEHYELFGGSLIGDRWTGSVKFGF